MNDSKEHGYETNHDPGMVPTATGFRAADPWEMEQPRRRARCRECQGEKVNSHGTTCMVCGGTGYAPIDFAPLYADEATRPIVHALVAAVGYINGQSVNSAAVLTAALKVGLKALERLQSGSLSDDLRITEAWLKEHGFTATVVHRRWELLVRKGLWLTVDVDTHYAVLGVSSDSHVDLIYKATRGTLRKMADAFGVKLTASSSSAEATP